jgi:DNA-binding transcriptional LysR family regulator
VQKLCAYTLSLAAHPSYLSAAAPLHRVADLGAHRIVGYVPDMIFDAELDFLAELGLRPHVSSNSAAVQVNLLQAGAGVGVIHDFARAAAPDLVRVLDGQVGFSRAFYLLRHSDEGGQARSRTLAGLIGAGVRAQVTRLETLARQCP